MRRNTLFLGVLLPMFSAASLLAGGWTVASTMRGSTAIKPVRPPLAAASADTIDGTAVVEPNSQTVHVAPPVAGIVTRVDVVAGAVVRKGDELFAIDDRSFSAQHAQAVANTSLAEAQLHSAQRSLAVQAAVIAQRRADLGGIEADRKRADQDRRRYVSLGDTGAASRRRRAGFRGRRTFSAGRSRDAPADPPARACRDRFPFRARRRATREYPHAAVRAAVQPADPRLDVLV